jgi:hypothetical protein
MPARSIIDCLTPVCSGVSFDSDPERRLVGVDCRLPVAGVMCEVKCLIGPRKSKSLRAGAHRIEILISGGSALAEVPTTGTGESRRADSPADSVATKHHVISYARASGRLAASRRNPARGVEVLPSSFGLEPTPMQ